MCPLPPVGSNREWIVDLRPSRIQYKDEFGVVAGLTLTPTVANTRAVAHGLTSETVLGTVLDDRLGADGGCISIEQRPRAS